VVKVAFRRSSGQVIPDFQSAATPEVLKANAVRAGIAASDVEVRDVTAAQFAALSGTWVSEAEAREAARRTDLASRAAKLVSRLGLTADDVEALKFLLRE
jgi:hypothetical protein